MKKKPTDASGVLRLLVLAMPAALLLNACGTDSPQRVLVDEDPTPPGIPLDVDEDGIRRFPWGADLDDDGDGRLSFLFGGSDHDDTDASGYVNGGDGTFDGPTYVSTGMGPTGLFLADFDNDSILDVVTSNQNDDTATIIFGDGTGVPMDPVLTLAVAGSGGSDAVAGDFDEDGLLDVVAGTSNTLFLNTGNRSFGAGIPLGSYGYRNKVLDVNGDDHLDLVGANYDDGIIVLLGNGDGTFGDPIYSGAGVGSQDIAVTHFDDDGLWDAVVVTYEGGGPSNLAVFLGNGDGTFQDPVMKLLPNYAWQVATGDLDGDGHADVIASDSIQDKLYVTLGDGSGGLADATTYTVDDVERMAIADFNGDTVPDLVVTSQVNGLWLGFGNGDGSFGDFNTIPGPTSAFDVDAGDMDNDGILDLVAIEISANRFFVQTGN